MNPRRRRALRAAVLCLVGLVVVVMAVGIAAVGWSTRVLRGGKVRSWVNDDPEKLFLDYEEASSSWPGQIHVRGLRLRGRDPNVEWEFRIEDCRIVVSLPDLLRKKFHATSVRATGLAFRLRQRLEQSRATSSRVRFIPRIEGFAAVPLRDRPVLRPAQNAQDLWSVQIDRLAASPVREIWVDTYRYTGNASLTGQLLLRPRLQASVGPATLTWRDGTLFIFGKPAAAPIRARIDCRIASYDPSRVRGPAVWDSISARVDWSGRLAGLEFFDPLFGGPPLLSGGRGTLSGRIRVDHGKGEARLNLAAEGAAAQYPKERLLGNVSAELRMDPWRPALGIANVAGSSVVLRNVRAPSEGSREWWGDFRIASGRLRSVPRGLQLTAKVDSRCRDARPLYTLFGVGLPGWTRGLAALEGFSGHAGLDFAPAWTRIDGLDASGGNFRVRGDLLRRGASKEGAFLVEDGSLRVGIEIDGSSTRLRIIGAEKWFRERAQASSKQM